MHFPYFEFLRLVGFLKRFGDYKPPFFLGSSLWFQLFWPEHIGRSVHTCCDNLRAGWWNPQLCCQSSCQHLDPKAFLILPKRCVRLPLFNDQENPTTCLVILIFHSLLRRIILIHFHWLILLGLLLDFLPLHNCLLVLHFAFNILLLPFLVFRFIDLPFKKFLSHKC